MSTTMLMPPSAESDASLRRRVLSYLATRNFSSLRALEIEARGGLVTVTGRVPSYHEKQVAQESCRRVAGVQRVVNRIEVRTARGLTA